MLAASHTNVFTGIFPVSHLNILANPGCKAKAAKNSKIRMNGGESNSLSDKIEDKYLFVAVGMCVRLCNRCCHKSKHLFVVTRHAQPWDNPQLLQLTHD